MVWSEESETYAFHFFLRVNFSVALLLLLVGRRRGLLVCGVYTLCTKFGGLEE